MTQNTQQEKVQLRRKLNDALKIQIDAGLILPAEESELQWKSTLDHVSGREDIKRLQEEIYFAISQFQKIAADFNQPTHNAVAFFEAAIKKEKELYSSKGEMNQFRNLIHLALSGRGFPFGTAFDLEHSSAV